MKKSLRSILTASPLVIGLIVSQAAWSGNTVYGGQSMVAPLKRVMVRAPSQAFSDADPIEWHYTDKPNLQNALKEHQAFVAQLQSNGVEVIYHDAILPNLADSIYVHDPVLMTDKGAVILSMGKALRKGEESAIQKSLESQNIPIVYKLTGDATAEGGDMLWLDEKTLLVGRSFRTNEAGISQLRAVLEPMDITVLSYDLPVDQGSEACLHLQSFISLVNENTAVVYRKPMPVALLEELEKRNFTLINVPDTEYLTMGPNILAIKPNVVLTIEGNPQTKQQLEANGVTVLTYKGDDISLKAEGGATCLTRPILRG